MLAPNFKDLLQIPFEQIWLLVETQKETIFISALTQGENKVLHISGTPEKLMLPNYSHFEFEYLNRSAEKFDDMIEDINRKFADHEVVKRISRLKSLIFLGLDRRSDNFPAARSDYYSERELRLRPSSAREHVAKRLTRGNLALGLMETELLVQNAYKRLRELEDRQSVRLRDSILLSAFKYSVFSTTTTIDLDLSWQERSGLLNRKIEIKEALSKIGVRNSKLGSELDEFFIRLTALFEGMASKDGGNGFEWLLNKAQIDRMSEIVDIIDEHKSKVDEIFRPINNFLSTVNAFFKDSHKRLELDAVGQLTIKRPDGKECTIEGLSSGERQLLVIFAHAFLNRGVGGNNVFIIDEPELSLHLSWQEKFSETILKISPNSQFILATHSPDIVGGNKKKSVRCR